MGFIRMLACLTDTPIDPQGRLDADLHAPRIAGPPTSNFTHNLHRSAEKALTALPAWQPPRGYKPTTPMDPLTSYF